MHYGDLIGVVIPCYNRARSIERAVGGMLLQGYQNFELVVDDDEPTAIVEAIDDPWLRVIRDQKNQDADAAKDDLIAFQDSDDNCPPEKLDVQMRQFCGLPEYYVAVFCTKIIHGRSVDRGGRKTYGADHASCVPGPDMVPTSGDLSQAFLRDSFMGSPTVPLTASASHAAGGYDLRLRNNNGWDLHLCLSRVCPIGFVIEPLTQVYHSADGISKNPMAKAVSTIVIFNKIRRHAPDAPVLATHAVAVYRHLMFKVKPCSPRRFLHRTRAISPGAWRFYPRIALTYAPSLDLALLQGRRRDMVRRPAETS